MLLALINEVDDYRTYPQESPRNANQSDPPNQRTCRIFDSLAEILVREVAGEVVALGAQRSDDKIIITFSTNQAQQPDHIYQQLETIWDLLKQASDVYHHHHIATNSPKSSPRSPRSPRSPCVTTTGKLAEKDQEKIYNLLRVIYKYSSQKYLSRVHKRRQAAKSTRFQVFQQIVHSINPSSTVKALLDRISTAVEIITRDLYSGHILNAVTKDFKELCGCFEHLAFVVKELEPYSQEPKKIADSNGMFFHYT